jgi:hypothetical protein
MAERLTVDQKAVGSTPIAHPKKKTPGKESFLIRSSPHRGRFWVRPPSPTLKKTPDEGVFLYHKQSPTRVILGSTPIAHPKKTPDEGVFSYQKLSP